MRKQNLEKDRYVFDSSAFFAFFDNEDGADIIQDLLELSKKENIEIFASFAMAGDLKANFKLSFADA